MKNLNTNMDKNNLKNLGTAAGIISIVIVAFYTTGLYRNYLEIKKLKKEDKKDIS